MMVDSNKFMMRRMQLSEVGRWAFPWLVEMGRTAKEKKVCPIDLADYYPDTEDAVVASIAGLLIPYNKRRNDYVTEFRNLLGEHPMEAVRSRAFLHYPSMFDTPYFLKAVSIRIESVVELLDWCWKMFVSMELPMEFVVMSEVTGKDYGPMRLAELTCMNRGFKEGMKMLLARMTMKDGIGRGVWHSMDEEILPLPLFPPVRNLLMKFYPLEPIDSVNVGEITEYLGFEKPIDFLYAYWGIERQNALDGGRTDSFIKNFREHLKLDKMLRWCSGLPYYTSKLKKEIPNIII